MIIPAVAVLPDAAAVDPAVAAAVFAAAAIAAAAVSDHLHYYRRYYSAVELATADPVLATVVAAVVEADSVHVAAQRQQTVDSDPLTLLVFRYCIN